LFDFRERGGLFLSSFQFLLLPIRVAKDSLLEFFNFLLYFFFLSFVLFSLLEEKERNKQKADRYTPSSLRRGLEKWGEEVYDINIHIPILNTCIYLQKRMQI
jgi:predicted PurR-regulated permease PerM